MFSHFSSLHFQPRPPPANPEAKVRERAPKVREPRPDPRRRQADSGGVGAQGRVVGDLVLGLLPHCVHVHGLGGDLDFVNTQKEGLGTPLPPAAAATRASTHHHHHQDLSPPLKPNSADLILGPSPMTTTTTTTTTTSSSSFCQFINFEAAISLF